MSFRLSSADRALAQSIEAAESAIISSLISTTPPFCVEATPGGGYCIFGGPGSPVTHAVGAGMAPGAGAAELDRIEEFYRSRGVGCFIDLCPLAAPEFIAAIQSRPYRVIELNNVVVRPIDAGEEFAVQPSVRMAGDGETSRWSALVGRGFADGAEPPVSTTDALAVCAPAAQCFFAALDGRDVAGAATGVRGEIAWMLGAATLPEARGRGLQRALIEARLAFAAARGCRLAGTAVLPGSASHRNYERAGFQLLYMRVNVVREWGTEVRP